MGESRNFFTYKKTRFILQILYRNASMYLHYLRILDKKSEVMEQKLHGSPKKSGDHRASGDAEISGILSPPPSGCNEVVLEKLLKVESIKKYPEDTDLLEDVITENKQAIEMAHVYTGILNSMMDTFSSVISNNVNGVMKFLTTITIVMAIPTMVFSAYGMNLNLSGIPFSVSHDGFLIVILISLALSLVVALICSKKDLF